MRKDKVINYNNLWFYSKYFMLYFVAGLIFAIMPFATVLIGVIVNFFVAKRIVANINKRNWFLMFLSIALLYHFIFVVSLNFSSAFISEYQEFKMCEHWIGCDYPITLNGLWK